jgi:hypothetical protein
MFWVMVGVAAALLVVIAAVVVAALAPEPGRMPSAVSGSADTSDRPTDTATRPTLPGPTDPGQYASATPDPAPSVPSAPPPSAPIPAPPTTNRTGPIVSAQNDRCVGLSGDAPSQGTAVHTAACDGSPAQTWSIMTDGTIRIGGAWCLVPADGSVAANTGTVIGTCNGEAVQQWRVLADSRLWNLLSGLCLTRPGGNPKAQLTTNTCGDATNQQWAVP